MLRSIFALICLLHASSSFAQTPLEVGATIPDNFAVIDSLERPQSFESLKGDKGLVLIFIRSADWCQYCKAQLRDWNTHLDALKKAGYKLAATSYDAPALLADFEQKNKLHYLLLSDTNSAMIKAFGIRNVKFDEGSRFYGIPDPAVYVINESGEISHVFRESHYQNRPHPEAVLEAISASPAAAADSKEPESSE